MLQAINRNGTDDKPSINFDPETGILEIAGRSLPENANSFYDPLEMWIEEYVKSPAPSTRFIFRLDYFNSSSASKLVKLMIYLEEIPADTHTVVIEWHYSKYDDMIHSRGEELQSIVEVSFQFVETA